MCELGTIPPSPGADSLSATDGGSPSEQTRQEPGSKARQAVKGAWDYSCPGAALHALSWPIGTSLLGPRRAFGDTGQVSGFGCEMAFCRHCLSWPSPPGWLGEEFQGVCLRHSEKSGLFN